MIGRFFEDLIVLKKGYEIKDFLENDFFSIKDDKVILFKEAYALKDREILKLKNGEYNIKEFDKIVIADELNRENFLNEFLYENGKFILLKKLDLEYECEKFKTEYSSFKKAEDFFSKFTKNDILLLIFNELFFNAYEHGNLGLSFEDKENLIKEDKYIEFLKSNENDKFIEICVAKKDNYIIVKITDEGEGFQLKEKTALYNGRGIKMSEKFAYLFYNKKGNSVIFIGKER